MTTVLDVRSYLESRNVQYEFDLVDEDDLPVTQAAIEALTLTLYDKLTLAIINTRQDQNVLNTNDVTIDSNGHVVWSVQALDNPLLDRTREQEQHIAEWRWEYDAGKNGNMQHSFIVHRLDGLDIP